MYHRFHGVREEPFGVSPDPRFFYRSEQHEEAAASIYYSVAVRRGFAALIAAPGLGKTSVIVSLLERLRNIAEVVFLVHPTLDGECVVRSVLLGLGVNSESDPTIQREQLTGYLLDLDRRGRSCVVILDEAQNLSLQALESIRMLSNFEIPGRKLLQFVLVGQPALADVLLRPECDQIRQRVNAIARLRPLTAAEVAAYIRCRLAAAGATHNPFTSDAVDAVARASGGVPRNINTLCFTALTLGFADANRTISEAYIAEAVEDLSLEPREVQQVPVLEAPKSFAWKGPKFELHNSQPPRARVVMAVLVTLAVAGVAFWNNFKPVRAGEGASIAAPRSIQIPRGTL